jgi:hypothetical protein
MNTHFMICPIILLRKLNTVFQLKNMNISRDDLRDHCQPTRYQNLDLQHNLWVFNLLFFTIKSHQPCQNRTTPSVKQSQNTGFGASFGRSRSTPF